MQKDGYTKWNKFNPTTGEVRDLVFGLVFGFGFVGVWFCWGLVLFCFNLNFAFGFYECNPLRPRSTVKCGRPRISKSDCLGPSGTRKTPLAWQVAEEGRVCEEHRQPAARHSGISNHAGKPTLPRGQDFQAGEKKASCRLSLRFIIRLNFCSPEA